jgi:hypothetical protein
MPWSFDFDWKNRILRARLYGRVTDEELKDMYRTGYKLIFRTQPSASILDGSAGTSFEISPETVRELAKSAPAPSDPDIIRVIIAPSAAFYGLARMFEIQGEETRPHLHVVRSEKEALAILAVQNPRFEPLDSQ